jgi:PAS domain S-box-containing protein
MAPLLRLILAPHWADEEKARQAFLLHVILLVTAGLTVVEFLLQLVLQHSVPMPDVMVFVAVAALLGLTYMLNRRSYVRLATYIFSGFVLIMVGLMAYSGMGMLDKIMYIQVVPIFIAGLIIGEQGAIGFTILVVIFNVLLFAYAPGGHDPVLPLNTTDVFWGLTDGIILDGFTGAILFLTARGIRISQKRVREKEEALLDQNRELQQVINERQRAEADLHSIQTLLTALMDNAPVPIYVLDPRTNQYRMVNHAWEKATRIPRAQAIGMTVEERFPPEAIESINQSTRQVVETGKSVQIEERLVSGDNEYYVYTSKFPLFNQSHEVELVGGITLDITELKRAERAVRESEERFRALIEKSSDIITIVGQDGNVRFISPSSETVLGYTPDEMIGKSQMELIHPDDREIAATRIAEQLATPNALAHTEMRVRRKDGTYILLESVARSLFHVPSIQGMVVNSRDITDRREVERQRAEAEALRRMVEQERQAIERKWRFVREMAHELRTPLAVMQTARDMLERYHDRLAPERRQSHLDEIGQQINAMTTMLNDVLTFSKGEAGRLEFSPRPLDLSAFCAAVVEQIRSTDKRDHAITLVVDEPAAGLYLLDEKLMRNIVGNLVSNAVKYSPAGSEIRVELTSDGQAVEIRVSDQGIGIPAEDQAHLFEPFYRASNAHQLKGTGLGLSIVRASVQAHGGEIACESQPGKGTTFRVRLPVLLEQASGM